MTISHVKSVGIYARQPSLSQKLGREVEAQATEKVPPYQHQVRQSVGMQSQLAAQKVKGALQNIGIARSFLLTAQANLGTVVHSVDELAGEVLTLLNGILPSGNTSAVAKKIIQTMGMVPQPLSRDQEEGLIIKTLREGGANRALYFHVLTHDFLSTDPDAVTPPKFDITGNPPPQTLIGNSIVQGAGFTGDLTVPPVATVTVASFDPNGGGATYDVSLNCGGVVYIQDGVKPEDNNPLILRHMAGAADDTLTFTYTPGTSLKVYSSQGDANAAAIKFKQALEACSTGTWTPEQMDTTKTKGFARFVLDPTSNYGAGSFFFKYDGTNVWFHDAYQDLIEAYPLPFSIIQEAGLRAKATSTPADVPIGRIGTLYVDENADGSPPTHAFTFQTKTIPYEAFLIVSANDDTRRIALPDLTNPLTLWGEEIAFDEERLQTDGTYQQKIKGMIDHGAQLLRETYQNLVNMMGGVEQDASCQNASLQSLKDLSSVAFDINALEVVTNVVDYSQQLIQLLNGVQSISRVQLNEQQGTHAITALAAEKF